MKKRNKIAILTEGPYSGILRSIIEDSRVMKDMGFEITYFLPSAARDRYGEKREKNILEFLQFGTVEFTPLRRKYRFLMFDVLRARRCLADSSFDVVISYGGYSGKLARILYMLGDIRRLIHVPQGFDTLYKKWSVRFPDAFFERILAKYCTWYFACGSSEAFKLEDTYQIPSTKICLNPNTIPLRKVMVKKSAQHKKMYVILSRISRDKRVEKSLKALRLLNLERKTVVIGDGEELPRLKKEYSEFTYLGNIPNEQTFTHLATTRFILSSSVIEGMPFSVLEAMSQGVVPILSRIDGHKDIILHGINGFLFDTQADLLDVLLYTEIMSDEEYASLSRSAIRTVQGLRESKQVRLMNFFTNDCIL